LKSATALEGLFYKVTLFIWTSFVTDQFDMGAYNFLAIDLLAVRSLTLEFCEFPHDQER